MSKKNWVVEIEEVVTSTFFIEAESYDEAMSKVETGDYDPDDKEAYFRENDRHVRDIISIKEHKDE